MGWSLTQALIAHLLALFDVLSQSRPESGHNGKGDDGEGREGVVISVLGEFEHGVHNGVSLRVDEL